MSNVQEYSTKETCTNKYTNYIEDCHSRDTQLFPHDN